MGANAVTVMRTANSWVAACPDALSRTVELATTVANAPPIACRRRATTSQIMLGARAASTDPTTNSASPTISGRRRPMASVMGPATS